jgi:hypothetical protein
LTNTIGTPPHDDGIVDGVLANLEIPDRLSDLVTT